MNKKVVIGLVAVGVVGLTALGIYLYRRNKKNNTEVINIDEVEAKDVPDIIKEKVEQSTVTTPATINYDSQPAIIALKESLGKGYYVMEILDNKNGVVINTISGKPVSDGLDTGVWMQMVRSSDRYKNQFLSTNPSAGAKSYGLNLISKMDKEISRIFSSSKYTTNNQWYKDYLAKGGSPVPNNIA